MSVDCAFHQIKKSNDYVHKGSFIINRAPNMGLLINALIKEGYLFCKYKNLNHVFASSKMCYKKSSKDKNNNRLKYSMEDHFKLNKN